MNGAKFYLALDRNDLDLKKNYTESLVKETLKEIEYTEVLGIKLP